MLKTLVIGDLYEPGQLLQVLEELPHCTLLTELRLELIEWMSWLSRSDEVGHVNFVCNASTL